MRRGPLVTIIIIIVMVIAGYAIYKGASTPVSSGSDNTGTENTGANNSGSASSTVDDAVKSKIASLLNLTSNDISIASKKNMDWPDACLGLAQSGEICAQVITPGYEFNVLSNGTTTVWRTNGDGSVVRRSK